MFGYKAISSGSMSVFRAWYSGGKGREGQVGGLSLGRARDRRRSRSWPTLTFVLEPYLDGNPPEKSTDLAVANLSLPLAAAWHCALFTVAFSCGSGKRQHFVTGGQEPSPRESLPDEPDPGSAWRTGT